MIETLGLFWLIASRTVWCPWVFFCLWVHGNKYRKHTILLLAVGLLWVCWLSHHYFHTANEKQKLNIDVLFFFFCQISLWVFFVHTTPTYNILKACKSFLDKCVTIILFKATAVLCCILRGRPTTTGRAAPGLGPELGPETGLVAGGWPGMFRRLNLGTTATLTLRLGRAWREGRFSSVFNWYVMRRLRKDKIVLTQNWVRNFSKCTTVDKLCKYCKCT